MLLPPSPGHTKEIMEQALANNPDLAEEIAKAAAGKNDMAGAVAAAMAANEANGTTPNIKGEGLESISNAEIRESFQNDLEMQFETNDLILSKSRLKPDLERLASEDIDWQTLADVKERLDQYGIESFLSIQPINLPLDEWQEGFSKLRQWQDDNDPDAPEGRRLKERSNGDGLWIYDAFKTNYDAWVKDTVANAPGTKIRMADGITWQVVLIPTVTNHSTKDNSLNGKVNYIRHDLATTQLDDKGKPVPIGGLNTETLNNLINIINSSAYTESSIHPPIGSYLGIQATRIHHKQAALDSDGFSWLNGKHDSRVPNSCFYPSYGQVSLICRNVSNVDGDLGIRPSVWG